MTSNIELTTKNLIYGPASNPGRSPFKPAVILTFSPIEYKGFSESTERVEIKAMFPRSLKTEITARCQHERRSKARFFQRRRLSKTAETDNAGALQQIPIECEDFCLFYREQHDRD